MRAAFSVSMRDSIDVGSSLGMGSGADAVLNMGYLPPFLASVMALMILSPLSDMPQ